LQNKKDFPSTPFNYKDINSKVYGEANFDVSTFKDQSAFKHFEDEDDEISLNSDR
jgi:hypothetical protein